MAVTAASSFDIAFWFLDRARVEGVALPTIKLQRLLFLAQGYFAQATQGGRLMPSVFVVTEAGPIDPNLERVFMRGVPVLETEDLDKPVVRFLEGIWRSFGSMPMTRLDKLVMTAEPVRVAVQAGRNTEVGLAAMTAYYAAQNPVGEPARAGAAKPEGTKSPPLPRYHKGKPVRKWLPGAKPEK